MVCQNVSVGMLLFVCLPICECVVSLCVCVSVSVPECLCVLPARLRIYNVDQVSQYQ